jgi:hypothetical protein
LLASFEVSGDVVEDNIEGTLTNRIRMEPVLLPGSPGRPQLAINVH